MRVGPYYSSFLVANINKLDNPASFVKLCWVKLDGREAKKALKRRQVGGKQHYELTFGIILSFGLTELTAQVCWGENVSCSFVNHCITT
jgi:hypothetical protein